MLLVDRVLQEHSCGVLLSLPSTACLKPCETDTFKDLLRAVSEHTQSLVDFDI